MSANLFGNRFFGNREAAWHGLGYVSQEDMSGQEDLSAFWGKSPVQLKEGPIVRPGSNRRDVQKFRIRLRKLYRKILTRKLNKTDDDIADDYD